MSEQDTGFPFGNVYKALELKQDRVDRPAASAQVRAATVVARSSVK